jgi:hypothetical protein
MKRTVPVQEELNTMWNDRSAVEAIELAERQTPFCACGEPTAPVAHDGAIWLECISRSEPRGSAFARIVGSIVSPGHVRQLILEDDEAA